MQVSSSTSISYPQGSGSQFGYASAKEEGPTTSRRDETESGASSSESEGEVGRHQELTPEQQREIQQLQNRDQQVRDHEAAHMAASGGLLINPASYTYQAGPDGNRYAVGGEVTIDTSPVSGNPEATIQKALQIQTAALAPADPSVQDRAVAASALQMAMAARMELAQQREEPSEGGGNTANNDNAISSYQATGQALQEPPESVVDDLI